MADISEIGDESEHVTTLEQTKPKTANLNFRRESTDIDKDIDGLLFGMDMTKTPKYNLKQEESPDVRPFQAEQEVNSLKIKKVMISLDQSMDSERSGKSSEAKRLSI